ncbi:NUDIX hydrolase [Halogeometricum limi]|uniref:ADP-ribose pyrophosphatase YjhB, NUDIX family n=1 Tax=Halogeometricum limi TaxID=555875 RepID=A0A1I6GN14_9EURY|nr:NUDIX domain-containing protein [Halogeometricum limi]SFR43590.1 ADP-ribose pyrophosphatase YjhB, NUDIX family [Halogeometricum limi]
MVVDDLWFLADEASQRAEQAYHRLGERYSDYLDDRRTRHVSRGQFRTLAARVKRTGAPYGAQTIVSRTGDELLLVRHDGVDMWVLPGGEVDDEETYHEAAVRELGEEAGVSADYRGLAVAARVDICCAEYGTWGVLPVFAATADDAELRVEDPDDEISAAEWFPVSDLPEDTRDRSEILTWCDRFSW